MLFKVSSHLAPALLLLLPNVLANPQELAAAGGSTDACDPPEKKLWKPEPADLSTLGAYKLCPHKFGNDIELDTRFNVIMTCTAGTPIEGNSIDQTFIIIGDTANKTKINGAPAINTPLRQVPGLGGSLARGTGFCRVYPDGNSSAAVFPPKAEDTDPVGACVSMWDNAGSSMGQEWDLEKVQLLASLFISFGSTREPGVNECHFGIQLASGSGEFASGCWGKYDKTKHLGPDGKTTFNCPSGT